MERLFRRAGLAVRMSEGFHPKPRMSFPSALGLGIAGRHEVVEIDFDDELPVPALLAALAAYAPVGLEFLSAEVVAPGSRKAQVRSCTYETDPPEARRAELPAAIARLLSATTWPIARPGRARPIDVRPLIEDLRVEGGRLTMRLLASHEAGARPRDVLAALGWHDDLDGSVWALERTEVELQP
jgi:radical SAM-linked protein